MHGQLMAVCLKVHLLLVGSVKRFLWHGFMGKGSVKGHVPHEVMCW